MTPDTNDPAFFEPDKPVVTYTLQKVKPTEFLANHANATPESLLDELKELRAAETLAKGQAGLVKTMLFARHDPQIRGFAEEHGTVFKSDNNTATLTWVVQSRFDQDLFQQENPELFKKYQKTTEFVQLKFNKE